MSFETAVPVVLASFLASAVEAVEAFTIVLAVSVVHGAKPAAMGAIAAMLTLALLIGAFGAALTGVPIADLQLTIGVLLLVFGLGWLRKAVLRAGGRLPLHDETAAFEKEVQILQLQTDLRAVAGQWLAGLAAYKAVLVEGLEVVFIVMAIGTRPGLLSPASIGAAGACAVVLAVGLLLRRPLARIPENSLKFAVGGLLTGFGVYWCCEGIGAPWPGDDWAILELVGAYLMAGVALSLGVRRWEGRST